MTCVQRQIRIGELARLSGVTAYYNRKWTQQGLIPHCKRPYERVLYPEDQACEAIQQILKQGGLVLAVDPAEQDGVLQLSGDNPVPASHN